MQPVSTDERSTNWGVLCELGTQDSVRANRSNKGSINYAKLKKEMPEIWKSAVAQATKGLGSVSYYYAERLFHSMTVRGYRSNTVNWKRKQKVSNACILYERDAPNNFWFNFTNFFPWDIQNCDSESYLNLPVFSLSWYITVKQSLFLANYLVTTVAWLSFMW